MRGLAALLLAGTLAGALSGCTSLFFHPQRELVDTPARFGIAYETVELESSDGTPLHAWFLPAKAPALATVLFLHGNAENISTHVANVAWMPAEGFNVLALDYRGYGASGGAPSLEGAQRDIDAAMRALLARPGVDPDRIIILGQSLGGALAIHYVAHTAYRRHIRALVSESAFADYRRIAREKLAEVWLTWPFQWLPWLVVNNRYAPEDAVAAVSPVPLLLIHGDADRTVPPHHGEQLLARAREPKTLWIIPGGGHIQALRREDVRRKLVEVLRQHSR